MEHIDFELQTVTPMFMAGEDGKTFELRPPSLKGVLRFWWRAYLWGRSRDELSLEDIQKEEGKIFGTASDNGHKSRFAIRVKSENLKGSREKLPRHPIQVTSRSRSRSFSINILDYLAYGTYDFRTGFNRDYLPVGQHATVRLSYSDEKLRKELVMAMYFLTTFGGLGSKSRNGYGSITITNPEHFADYELPYPFPDSDFLKRTIVNHHLPSFSALSANGGRGMKIFALRKPSPKWDDCLAELGKAYRDTRGRLEPKHQYAKRQYISAPLIAGKKQLSFSDRHAKPYFLRVIRTSRDFEGYILYLPSKYSIDVPQKGGSDVQHTEKFLKYCNEFNGHLAKTMEVYYG